MSSPISGDLGRALMASLAAIVVLLLLDGASGFYLPGSYMRRFAPGEELSVKVNSLTSVETELPFSYYSLPFCRPQEGVRKSAENLGELLMGDDIDNSPYKFHSGNNESSVFVCSTPPLSHLEAQLLKRRIEDLYQLNFLLDNLPAIRYTWQGDYVFWWTGVPVGSHDDSMANHYIFNHLRFTVLIHEGDDSGIDGVMALGDGLDSFPTAGEGQGYQVVGFEVAYCSVDHDPKSVANLSMYAKISPAVVCNEATKPKAVREGESITFSYDVVFEKSPIRWPSRWDAYLKMEGSRVHWFSILNSLMVIAFLAGIVFVIFLRTIRRDLTKYDELDKEAQAQMNEELSGWKLVVGDVFRVPPHKDLLCVMVGDGVQITGMAVVTIFFAALGFMSPASRGMLLTGMILVYLVLGIAAGYVSVRLWRMLDSSANFSATPANFGGDGWWSIAWRVACFFPAIVFGILMLLNFLLRASRSTGALPISLFFILLALWFCISVPLTLLGGYFGSRADPIPYPVRTNQIPREIPPQKYPSWLLVLGAGTLPFGTLFIELFFIMSSIWLGRFYYVFGFLLLVLVLLVIVCAEVSVVLSYMHLCAEDWQWWWKSFFASASVALYVFLYSVNYLVFDLKSLSGPVSAVLYLGYSVLMAIAIMLATGTIGFLASFAFIHYLFSSVKID